MSNKEIDFKCHTEADEYEAESRIQTAEFLLGAIKDEQKYMLKTDYGCAMIAEGAAKEYLTTLCKSYGLKLEDE